MTWDVVVVGAGPAGSAAALGALAANPALRVLLLDREDFPRDKPCGDGVAPHVLDVLRAVGVTDMLADQVPVRRLTLRAGARQASREMARPALVVPRSVLDARLVAAATARGAELRRHRVRRVEQTPDGVVLDEAVDARVVVGADGARSAVRHALGLPDGRRRALAIRGYAPTAPHRRHQQVIVLGRERQPSYAWSFDRGDGVANVGYGELLRERREPPTRTLLLRRLDELLPGASSGGSRWRAHHLPLSSARWQHPRGAVLLAGDAASLVNPLTGEGIYYAVATGVLAGRAAAAALAADDTAGAADRYSSTVRALLARHLATTRAVSRLAMSSTVVSRAVGAAWRDQRVFDDLVEIGLGQGLLTRPVLAGLVRTASRPGTLAR